MKCVYLNPVFNAGRYNDISVQEKVRYTGHNTGNLVFIDAIKQQIQYDKETGLGDVSLNELSQGNVGVLSCANFLNVTDTYLCSIENVISNLEFPVTLVGLGAQSTSELNTPKKLMAAMSEEKVISLHKICDQAVSIGVRGEFTAECLEIVGIKNYRVIGCPSLYKYEEDFYNMKQPKAEKCVINIITGVPEENKVIEFALQNNMKWIMQSMAEMPRTVYENRELTNELVRSRLPGYRGSKDVLQNFMVNNAKIFFDIQEWYSYMEEESFTFSFGARFHGNVVALRSGIPALWIVHDSRTRELTELFHLPAIEFSKLDKIKYVEELLEHCLYEEFHKKYPYMLKEYIDFLDENHIDHVWN